MRGENRTKIFTPVGMNVRFSLSH